MVSFAGRLVPAYSTSEPLFSAKHLHSFQQGQLQLTPRHSFPFGPTGQELINPSPPRASRSAAAATPLEPRASPACPRQAYKMACAPASIIYATTQSAVLYTAVVQYTTLSQGPVSIRSDLAQRAVRGWPRRCPDISHPSLAGSRDCHFYERTRTACHFCHCRDA